MHLQWQKYAIGERVEYYCSKWMQPGETVPDAVSKKKGGRPEWYVGEVYAREFRTEGVFCGVKLGPQFWYGLY